MTIDNPIISGSVLLSGSLSVNGNVSASAFIGNGSQLTGITGSATFPYTGSAIISGSLRVTGSLNVSGSTTQIGNNRLIGDTTISGSLTVSGSFPPGSYSSSVNIYGDTTMTGYLKFNPQPTNIDTTISASYVYVSGSTNDLYFSQNSEGFTNTTRLRWLEGNLYTGLLSGGLITTQSATVYQVSSGSGIIVSMNSTLNNDPYPTTQFITWGNLSSSIAPLSSSFDQSFISIEATGSKGKIYTQGLPYDDGQFNTLIPIGNVIHQNRSTINATATYPSVAYAYKQRSSDFLRAFGALKLSGLTTIVSGSSTGSLQITSGTAYSEGRNYTTDPNNPSYVIETGQPISKIFRYYQSGSNGWGYLTNGGAGFQNIDPANYSLNGTLTPVPTNDFTIQRVFYFPGGATKGIYVYYGNRTYPNLEEAVANIPYEPFIEAPNTAAGAIFSAYLIVRHNADFSIPASYNIQQGGLFRNVGGTGGGGSAIVQTLFGLSDVSITAPSGGQPLVYNGSTLRWENSSTLTASLIGNSTTATTAATASSVSPLVQNVRITGSLSVTQNVIAQSFTGSLQGTGSYATQALSSSFATTASYALNSDLLDGRDSTVFATTGSNRFNGNQIITGSLIVSGSTTTLTGNATITGSLNITGGITGSLLGTSSYATQALSSSFATTASYVLNAVSASFATTASFVTNGITGTGVTNYIAKFSGSRAVSSSILYDNGTQLVVAGTTPTGTAKLTIAGNTAVAGGYLWVTNGVSYLNGNTIVGSNDEPLDRLDVRGNVRADGQYYSPVNAKGNSSGSITFNWNDGNIQSLVLTGSCTFVFSNPQSGATYQIIATQDATGGRSITWPTIHWEGKTTPSLTGTSGSTDVTTFTYDGAKYLGVISKNHGG